MGILVIRIILIGEPFTPRVWNVVNVMRLPCLRLLWACLLVCPRPIIGANTQSYHAGKSYYPTNCQQPDFIGNFCVLICAGKEACKGSLTVPSSPTLNHFIVRCENLINILKILWKSYKYLKDFHKILYKILWKSYILYIRFYENLINISKIFTKSYKYF